MKLKIILAIIEILKNEELRNNIILGITLLVIIGTYNFDSFIYTFKSI